MNKNLNYYFSRPLSNRNFQKIYQLSATQLYGVILRILKQEQISEECLQEVFVKIYHNFEKYNQEKAKPLTWMVTIARNHAIDFYRKKRLPVYDDFDLSVIDDEQIQLLEKLEQSENKKQLEHCLEQLPSNVRDAVFFIYFHNKTYAQVAKNMNRSENTIKPWVSRSLLKLKSCMESL
ncbi:MAG: ECF RNA polymerase sigma factor SigK [Catillopecten margaritatus gill symbiont]|uniref:ECF RNA polymerase sigma factor SigK n=1 Tax=Catillopecten margaritatus gill symbiont TaxID=3083288 RepID=A0AAU6PFM3_9GAMM